MCGRFAQIREEEELMKSFSVQTSEISLTRSFNIAPGSEVTVIQEEEGLRKMTLRRWGLVPFWARKGGRGMINARSETVRGKPSFRQSFIKRRCLIPANGFYEWKKGPGGKQPFFISAKALETLAFAGIWDQWRSAEGDRLQSCAILTCDANSLMKPIHHRMPVIIGNDQFETWLGNAGPDQLQKLMKPFPPERMQAWSVTPKVNRPSFNGPECFEPIS